MPVEHVVGNLLNWERGTNVICHCVSLQRVMGAGVALQIAEEYPAAKEAYLEAFTKADGGEAPMPELGCLIVATVPGGKRIIHLVAQADIGTHKTQLDYDALRDGLTQVREILEGAAKEGRNWVLGLPKWIGAGYAGGDPVKVEAIVNDIFGQSPVRCVVVERRARSARAAKPAASSEPTSTNPSDTLS